MKLLTVLLLGVLRVYRLLLSPALTWLLEPMGMGCRFTPSCSRYASEAIAEHGPFKGTRMAFQRLCRCNPWGNSGYDPVPRAAPSTGDATVRAEHST
jgi:putative membrane protein insertion efficiency factor